MSRNEDGREGAHRGVVLSNIARRSLLERAGGKLGAFNA